MDDDDDDLTPIDVISNLSSSLPWVTRNRGIKMRKLCTRSLQRDELLCESPVNVPPNSSMVVS